MRSRLGTPPRLWSTLSFMMGLTPSASATCCAPSSLITCWAPLPPRTPSLPTESRSSLRGPPRALLRRPPGRLQRPHRWPHQFLVYVPTRLVLGKLIGGIATAARLVETITGAANQLWPSSMNTGVGDTARHRDSSGVRGAARCPVPARCSAHASVRRLVGWGLQPAPRGLMAQGVKWETDPGVRKGSSCTQVSGFTSIRSDL